LTSGSRAIFSGWWMRVGDPRVVAQLLKQLLETSFKGRQAKVGAAEEDGKIIVRRLGAGSN
ncbi:MAG TPA: hypothetical protein VLJ17_14625, partial [Xanthobacteraceae bacterium]|nr:hypothetical protein [Xanthobacteraceae bacterium]